MLRDLERWRERFRPESPVERRSRFFAFFPFLFLPECLFSRRLRFSDSNSLPSGVGVTMSLAALDHLLRFSGCFFLLAFSGASLDGDLLSRFERLEDPEGLPEEVPLWLLPLAGGALSFF